MKKCIAMICIGCGLGSEQITSDTKQTTPMVVPEKKQIEKKDVSEKEPLIFSRWAAWHPSAQLRKK